MNPIMRIQSEGTRHKVFIGEVGVQSLFNLKIEAVPQERASRTNLAR